MEIACRSPQEINDDNLIEAHTNVCDLLAERGGGKALFLGRRRDALIAIRNDLAERIEGAGKCPDLIFLRIHHAAFH